MQKQHVEKINTLSGCHPPSSQWLASADPVNLEQYKFEGKNTPNIRYIEVYC